MRLQYMKILAMIEGIEKNIISFIKSCTELHGIVFHKRLLCHLLNNLFLLVEPLNFFYAIYVSFNWAPSSEFVSLSIPSWQILTAHAQPVSGARDLAFCLKVPLDSMLVWASSGDSGETARMCRLASTFAACIGDKYQIRLTRPIYYYNEITLLDDPPIQG